MVNADERGSSGAPDRVYCYRGRFIAVEYKRSEKEKLRKLQQKHKEWIEKAGGIHITASSWADVEPYVNLLDWSVKIYDVRV